MSALKKIDTSCCECGSQQANEYEYDFRNNRWLQDVLQKNASGLFEFMCPSCVKGINEGKDDE